MIRDEVLRLWQESLGSTQLDLQDPSQTFKFPILDASQATIADPRVHRAPLFVSGNALSSEAETVLETRTAPKPMPHDTSLNNSKASLAETLLEDRAGASSAMAPGMLTLERYQLQEEIGRGGMGVVYRAEQRSLGREVAIKKVRGRVLNHDFLEKFASEGRLTGALDHPNIVPVYDMGQDEQGQALLVMKLIGGVEWKRLLHPQSPSEHERAAKTSLVDHLKILMSVCNAVAFAHSRGVIHADLKPENVMIGEYGEVFVMDWGVAVDVREQDARDARRLWVEHKSTVRQPRGTPVYMPPELASGDGFKLGVWTDIYLLGAILFELLTGSPPHRAQSLTEVLKRAQLSEAPSFDRSVPEELTLICRRAMNRIPGERPQSALDFQRQLEDFLEHRESIVISERAEQLLSQSLKDMEGVCRSQTRAHYELYSQFAEAVAGFAQAQMLWPQNLAAKAGEGRARRAYARLALKLGDLGLAESQAEKLEDSEGFRADELRAAVKEAQAERAARRREAEAAKARERAALAQAQRMLARAYLEKARSARSLGDVLAAQVFIAKSLSIEPQAEARGLLMDLLSMPGRAVWSSRTRGHEAALVALGFDSSGEWVVTLGEEGQVICWEQKLQGTSLESLEPIVLLKSTTAPLCLAMHPTKSLVAVGFADGAVKLWELGRQRLLVSFQGHSEAVRSLCFSGGGEVLATACAGGELKTWGFGEEALSEAPLARVQTEHGAVHKVLFNCQSSTWASLGEDGVVRFWSAALDCFFEYQEPNVRVRDFVLTHCGQLCATASSDGTIKMWRTENGFVIFANHAPKVCRIEFASDGYGIATATDDGLVRIWGMQSGRPSVTLRGHVGRIRDMKFCPVTGFLASAGEDMSVRVWNWRNIPEHTRRHYQTLTETDELRLENNYQWRAVAQLDELDWSQGALAGCSLELLGPTSWRLLEASGESLLELETESEIVQWGLSRTAQRLAARCQDGSVWTWSLATVLKEGADLLADMERDTGLVLDEFQVRSRQLTCEC